MSSRYVLNSARYAFKSPSSSVDHLVIGSGVVGLAVAARLDQLFPAKSTYVVERHSTPAEEISSRNSEVIHSGIYYPPDSLKTRLCVRGRDLLYEYCRSHHIPHRQTGKLVVATSDEQLPYIHNLHEKSPECTEIISASKALGLEPSLTPKTVGALWAPLTGIIDTHSFAQSLDTAGNTVYSTRVVRIDQHDEGCVVQLETNQEPESILARKVINAGGLSAPRILNSLLKPQDRLESFYARGSYATYSGPGIDKVRHLMYPCPSILQTNFASLGTHLTLDLSGRIRFGPDLEWLEADEQDADFWTNHLTPSTSRLPEIYEAVKSYLPEVVREGFAMDYVGVRPKLVGPGGGFQDFVFRKDGSMISLLGIESPGLTASLAIAEYVVDKYLI